MTVADFFKGDELAASIHKRIEAAVSGLSGTKTVVQKSQIKFSHSHPYAAAWRPEQYLKRPAAPLVLSLFTRKRIASKRFKEVIEPARGRFTHHLELRKPADVDAQVRRWLKRAWKGAVE